MWAGHLLAFSRMSYGHHRPWLLRWQFIMRLLLSAIPPRNASAGHLLLGVPCKAQRRQFRAYLENMTFTKRDYDLRAPAPSAIRVCSQFSGKVAAPLLGGATECTQNCLGHQSLNLRVSVIRIIKKLIQEKVIQRKW